MPRLFPLLPCSGLLQMPHRQIEVTADSGGNVIGASVRYNIPCGCSSAVFALPLVLLVKWFWPTVIPFDLFAFWNVHGNLGNLASDIWPFLVGTVVLFLILLLSSETVEQRWNFRDYWAQEGDIFQKMLSYFTAYGLLEELIFRWLLFYSYIVGLTVLNFLLVGFAGFGIPQWLFLHVFGPLADFVTFYKLHDFLFSTQYSWVVGAAILTANGKFRQGHLYQGWSGWVWSWYGGMFLFLVMFKYGLLTAIVLHIVYNFVIFWMNFIFTRYRGSSISGLENNDKL
jgi:hypothetical protein